jgi:hypothetical protein
MKITHGRTAALALLVAAGASLLTGCSSSPDGKQKYASLDAFRDAVVDAGMGCTAYKVTGERTASCNDWTTLVLYDSSEKRDEAVKTLTGTELIDVTVLVGENWVVNGHRDDLVLLQKKLGGAIEGRGDGVD